VLGPRTWHAHRQVLPLKSAVGDFLLDTLEGRSLPALFKLAEEFDMRRLRSALVAHTALNLGALAESLPATSLAVDVWRDVLSADTVTVRSDSGLCSGTQLELSPYACRSAGPAELPSGFALASLARGLRWPELWQRGLPSLEPT